MNPTEMAIRILHYQPVERVPVVHFGYWNETLQKWATEGHLSEELARAWSDGNPADAEINTKLGFDFDWYSAFHPNCSLKPEFEPRVVQEFPDGSKHVLNSEGVIVLQAPDAGSIPTEIEHLFRDRASWEKEYRWRLQWNEARVTEGRVRMNAQMVRWDQGGLEFLKTGKRDYHYGLHCGSLFGAIRNIIGVENCAYLHMDDEALFTEIIEIYSDICYRNTKLALESGAKFDFAHFWEDICFKNGPLISPAVFAEKVGPHYRRITDLVRAHGIEIISLDCDGMIDSLLPIWLENGVNTMFPIEVGTWNASIAPWREKYGRELRGVGGMNKVVFARDRAAVDAEIERLRPLVELGGYLPCPDHRIPPDAEWDLVRYYCDRFRAVFG